MPQSTNPPAAPPSTERVDPVKYSAFCAAIGSAVTDWQKVEAALSDLLVTALNGPDQFLVGEMFFAVVGFRDKLAMVDGAVTFVLQQRIFGSDRAEERACINAALAGWNKIREKARKRSLKRNQLAHGFVWNITGAGGVTHRIGPQMGHISKFTHAITVRGHDGRVRPEIRMPGTTEITATGNTFEVLTKRIKAFNDVLVKLLQRPTASS